MPPVLTLALALALTMPGDDPNASAVRDELERHRGTWAVVAFAYDGREAPEETIGEIERVVAGDRAAWRRDGATFSETTIAIDPTVEPRAIDVIPDGGPAKGRRVPGIYRFDGDRLTICMAEAGGERPEAFVAAEGSRRTLMVLKRSQPGR